MAAGLLVGLCTFPCSGGIYVSIITLLNAKRRWPGGWIPGFVQRHVCPAFDHHLVLVGNRMAAKAGRAGNESML